jgi:hypothetical protein
MGSFKNFLRLQEKTLGSDGVRDNAPTQTNQDTQAVADRWLGNPKNVDFTSNLLNIGRTNRSALTKPLLDAGAQAVKFSPLVAKGTDAPTVANAIQNTLNLPDVLKAPKPTQVRI